MSGSPSVDEVKIQWKAAINILEKLRAYADGTFAGDSNLFDTLIQSLKGEYTPANFTSFGQDHRSGLSDLLDPAQARSVMDTIFREWSRLFTEGSAYTTSDEMWRALYEYFVDNSELIESREISFDSSQTAAGTGNSSLYRLNVDENGNALECTHVEKKQFRCIRDQNSGTVEDQEEWSVLGAAAGFDNLLIGSFGGGIHASGGVFSRNAGSGNGGSLLRNSSFASYNVSNTPAFTGWTETAGGDYVTQDTTAGHYYRQAPGEATPAALKITGGSGQVLLKQTILDSRRGTSGLDATRPYFLRAMVNGTVGSASGGSFFLRLGSQAIEVTVATIVGSGGWYEVKIPIDENLWFRNFNVDPLDIEIEWNSSSASGYLLVDDVYFGQWDLIDGTYWLLIGANDTSHTPSLLDATIDYTDTGGAPGTGILQYWLWRAGRSAGRYWWLPSSSTSPTIADPT